MFTSYKLKRMKREYALEGFHVGNIPSLVKAWMTAC